MTRFSSPSPGPMPLGLLAGGPLETEPLAATLAAALAAVLAVACAAVADVVGAAVVATLAGALAGETLAGPVVDFCVGAGVAPDDEQADTIKARVAMTPQIRPMRTSPPLPPGCRLARRGE